MARNPGRGWLAPIDAQQGRPWVTQRWSVLCPHRHLVRRRHWSPLLMQRGRLSVTHRFVGTCRERRA